MAMYAHYCLQKLHILPSTFDDLDINEKAFIIASVDIRADDEKKLSKK